MIIVCEMTSHCSGTAREKRESEIVIGKREKAGFKTTLKGREKCLHGIRTIQHTWTGL